MIGHPPTPPQLDEQPQLAVLFALEAALEAAAVSLIASHAQLRDGQCVTERDTPARIAYAFLATARELASLIRLYRRRLPGAPKGPLRHDYEPL